MLTHIIKIDKYGRIELPEKIRKVFGLLPNTDVIVELKDDGVFLKPKLTVTPVTQKIAEMNLPISDWVKMEKEIEAGHLK